MIVSTGADALEALELLHGELVHVKLAAQELRLHLVLELFQFPHILRDKLDEHSAAHQRLAAFSHGVADAHDILQIAPRGHDLPHIAGIAFELVLVGGVFKDLILVREREPAGVDMQVDAVLLTQVPEQGLLLGLHGILPQCPDAAPGVAAEKGLGTEADRRGRDHVQKILLQLPRLSPALSFLFLCLFRLLLSEPVFAVIVLKHLAGYVLLVVDAEDTLEIVAPCQPAFESKLIDALLGVGESLLHIAVLRNMYHEIKLARGGEPALHLVQMGAVLFEHIPHGGQTLLFHALMVIVLVLLEGFPGVERHQLHRSLGTDHLDQTLYPVGDTGCGEDADVRGLDDKKRDVARRGSESIVQYLRNPHKLTGGAFVSPHSAASIQRAAASAGRTTGHI